MRASPKPEKAAPKARKPMKRGKPMRQVGKRGAAFPKVKSREFRTWLRTEHGCEIAARRLTVRISPEDFRATLFPDVAPTWVHRCWLPIDPAHVGKKQSQGAGDVGHCVPLCRAAHRFYDRKRAQWEAATGLSEAEMARRAGGYGLAFVERGGLARASGGTAPA